MPAQKSLLDENWRYSESARVNDPVDYVKYLKNEPRFKGCGLDQLPKHAIILHDAAPNEHLVRLGYAIEDIVVRGMVELDCDHDGRVPLLIAVTRSFRRVAVPPQRASPK